MSMEVVERNWYRADRKPEQHVQTITMIFYGTGEADEAKRLAKVEADAKRKGMTRDAATFCEVEPCARVVILPGVTGHHRAKIVAAYGELVDGGKPSPVVEAVTPQQQREPEPVPDHLSTEVTPAPPPPQTSSPEPPRNPRGRPPNKTLV